MIVLARRYKRCSHCHAILPLATFPVVKGQPYPWCRPCRREWDREYRRKRRADPERRERERAYQREYFQRVHNDPKFRERRRKAARERWQRIRDTDPERYAAMVEEARKRGRERWERIRQDPERYAIALEDARIRAKLSGEKKGRELRPVDRKRWVGKGRPIYLDVEPIREVAKTLTGLDHGASFTRLVYRTIHESAGRVELSTVDAIALAAGLMPHDIYPELAA